LTYVQLKALETWITNNWESFVKEHTSQPEAAERATKACGFEVTGANIQGMCNNLQKAWPNGRGSGQKAELVRELAKEIALLQSSVSQIALAVSVVSKDLGMTQIERDMVDLAGKLKRHSDVIAGHL
jgi:hypothetical protein